MPNVLARRRPMLERHGITIRDSEFLAIVTKYIGATNTLGARMVAKCGTAKITIPQRSNLSADQNHAEAALEYARRQGWRGNLIGGSTGIGYAWVFCPDGGTRMRDNNKGGT